MERSTGFFRSVRFFRGFKKLAYQHIPNIIVDLSLLWMLGEKQIFGELAERLMALVLKTRDGKPFQGSNPWLSVKMIRLEKMRLCLY